MRRLIIPFVLLVGVLTLAASGLADPGDKGKGKAQGKNKFSFQLTTTDRRCDGTEPWAQSLLMHRSVVHSRPSLQSSPETHGRHSPVPSHTPPCAQPVWGARGV